VHGVFGPGANTEDVSRFVRDQVESKA